jgi:hypothetical protein
MSILRLVRNFALLAVLALAAHAAAGANKGGGRPHQCGGACGFFGGCAKGCVCVPGPFRDICVPKSH